jgi:tight adherence protein B
VGRGGNDDRADTSEDLARHVHRVAVLLAAGVAPASTWRHVAELTRPEAPALAAVARRLDAGESVGAALLEVARGRDDGWRALGAAWSVATTSGAPLAPALTAFAEAVRDRAAAERDIAVALASPRATARVVQLLPLVSLGLAVLLGVDMIAAVRNPLGAASMTAGLMLAVLGRRWMRRMLTAAHPPPPTAGLALDLLAVAAAGGGSPEAARRLVERALSEAQLSLPAPAAGSEHLLTELVELSRRSGAPLGALARAEASEARTEARAQARQKAEELGVRLLLPLGVCVLPSFLLVGIAPMILGLISSTAVPTF